jgi:hypothetical protein
LSFSFCGTISGGSHIEGDREHFRQRTEAVLGNAGIVAHDIPDATSSTP